MSPDESKATMAGAKGSDAAHPMPSTHASSTPAGTGAVSVDRPLQNDPFLVFFKRNDKECPFYFPMWKKWMIVVIMACQIIWIAGIGASWSPANVDIAEAFGTSNLVARIPQAMYLVGFSLGPVVLTPFSEDYGRKPIFAGSLALTYIFQIPIALAPNYATLVVFRFLSGFVASPIFNSCCNIPDLWRSTDEFVAGLALNLWAFSAEIIIIAPVWGVYINQRLGWRWLWGVSALVGAALTLIFVAFIPETRHTVLLAKRAKRLRKMHQDDRYRALGERHGRRSLNEVLKETLYRPVFMLLTEPIVNLFALYDGLNYGIIYLAIEAVPFIYEAHGFHDPGVEFIFFAFIVGFLIAIAIWPLQWWANRKLNERVGEVVPEGKLYWGFLAGIFFPISLYLIAWLSLPHIHWFASVPPIALFALASHILFLMVSDYTVDSYGHLASSAITGQSFARELMSAGLIVVGETYYRNLGTQVATTILAAIATALGVLPFLFYLYGPKIRERSHYSKEIKQAAREDEEREKLEDTAPTPPTA